MSRFAQMVLWWTYQAHFSVFTILIKSQIHCAHPGLSDICISRRQNRSTLINIHYNICYSHCRIGAPLYVNQPRSLKSFLNKTKKRFNRFKYDTWAHQFLLNNMCMGCYFDHGRGSIDSYHAQRFWWFFWHKLVNVEKQRSWGVSSIWQFRHHLIIKVVCGCLRTMSAGCVLRAHSLFCLMLS